MHLASGCFDGPLSATDPACRRLSAQLEALEAWIDARSEEGTAAIVLGDFNRRFFQIPGGDAPWRALDDAEPPSSDLSSPTAGRSAACLDGRYPDFIDHLVFNTLADPLQVPGSFQEHLYDLRDVAHQGVLSDHCPLSVGLGGADRPRTKVGW